MRRAGGREVTEHKDIALALGALLFLPFPAGETCPLWFSQRQLFLVPASTLCLGEVGCCQPGTPGSCRGWHSRSLPTASLHTLLSVLKSFFVFLQMLGSLEQRFSICRRLPEQVTLPYTCTIPHPLQGSQPWRAGHSVDLSISFFPFAVRPSVTVAGRLKPRDTR